MRVDVILADGFVRHQASIDGWLRFAWVAILGFTGRLASFRAALFWMGMIVDARLDLARADGRDRGSQSRPIN